ncbi:hypothetical protein WJX72_002467 [[Myrmecia] bisecta]|uniref:EF-hand domain-containing protein n=1 Tax=[Myrmecia] bisecta TaxID=41462 RepID=A0AAW1PP45_9CHLO
MGGKSSKTASAGNFLEEKLAEVIKRKAARRPPPTTKFTKLLLRFPQMRNGFNKCRAVFRDIDADHSRSVDLQELRIGCRRHGFSVPDDLVVKIFQSTDLDGNHVLDFREFIVVLAIISMFEADLHGGTGPAQSLDPEIVQAFAIAEEAFLYFDASRDGYMQKDEVMAALAETETHIAAQARPGSLGPRNTSILAKRFEEMDWDNNGQISFKEFLYAVQSWVLDEDDEVEDAEANANFDSLRKSDF